MSRKFNTIAIGDLVLSQDGNNLATSLGGSPPVVVAEMGPTGPTGPSGGGGSVSTYESLTGPATISNTVTTSFLLGTGFNLTANSTPGVSKTIVNMNENVYENISGITYVDLSSSSNFGFNYISSIIGDNSGTLYVGGRFNNIGGVSLVTSSLLSSGNLAKFDGNGWTGLSAYGINSPSTSAFNVTTMEFGPTGLYIGGSFTSYYNSSSATSLGTEYLVRYRQWDNTFDSLGITLNGFINTLKYIPTEGSFGALYIGGAFTIVNGDNTGNLSRIFKYVFTTPTTGTVTRLNFFGNLGNSINSAINTMATDSSGNLYIGGGFVRALDAAGNLITANGIMKYDGSGFNAMSSGVNGAVQSVVVDSNDNIYIAGTFNSLGGNNTTINIGQVAKWNPSVNEWEPVGSGIHISGQIADGFIRLTLDSNDNLYVIGMIDYAYGKNIPLNGIAKWDGIKWSTIGSGFSTYSNNNPTTESFQGIIGSAYCDCMNNDLYVGGNFMSAGNIQSPLVTKLNLDNINKVVGPTGSVYYNGTNYTDIQFTAEGDTVELVSTLNNKYTIKTSTDGVTFS